MDLYLHVEDPFARGSRSCRFCSFNDRTECLDPGSKLPGPITERRAVWGEPYLPVEWNNA